MAENLGKRPSKGILKTSSSFEKPDAPKRKQKETKWDEMNIIATLHPPDKEYGHMKIEEPKTPYNWVDADANPDELDASVLAEKIRLEATKPPKSIEEEASESEEEEEEAEDTEDETEEMREKRVAFESKRKAHYNEYYAVKLARKLMEQDQGGDEDSEHDENVELEDKNSQQMSDSSDSNSNMNCHTLPATTGDCS